MMSLDLILNAVTGTTQNPLWQTSSTDEVDDEFKTILKKYDEEKKLLDEEAKQQREADKRIKEEKEDKEKRLAELRALIARYKQKAMGKGDIAEGAAAMVSQLENEIFWLMFEL